MKTCRNCGQRIPRNITIDGKRRNLQNRSVCLECVPFGSRKGKSSKTSANGMRECNKCFELKSVDHFYASNGKLAPHCKKCASVVTLEQMRKAKLRAVEYLGGKCSVCGYNRYIGALEFHHKSIETKEFHIGCGKVAWEKLKKELDKCVLLCANCHKEIHSEECRKMLEKEAYAETTY